MVPFAQPTEEVSVSDEQPNDGGRPDDPYSRAQYRKLIAWGKRIEREGPFLASLWLFSIYQSTLISKARKRGCHARKMIRYSQLYVKLSQDLMVILQSENQMSVSL